VNILLYQTAVKVNTAGTRLRSLNGKVYSVAAVSRASTVLENPDEAS
jgi:hypothetical protein